MKRILRYVHGSLDLGFHLYRTSLVDLTVYSNADWADCLDTRRSTSGYGVFLGEQPHLLVVEASRYYLTI
jgi:hypothetical protein